MIELPKDHSDPLVVGVGRHRVCYIHPEDPRKCIKVIYNPDPHAFQEIKREVAYYRHLEKYLKDWSGLPRFYGEVQTNLGRGFVYDRVIDFDGQPSKTIEQRYDSDNFVQLYTELLSLIGKLRDYLWSNRIVTMSIKPYNVLCHRISASEIVPVVCDNIGSASVFPIEYVCPWFCHKRQERQFKRFICLFLNNKLVR